MSRQIFNATVAGVGTTLSTPIVLHEVKPADGFRASVIASAVGGTGQNFAISVEDSPDDINWFTRGSFTAITGNGSESIAVAGPIHTRVRIKIVVTGTSPTADLQVFVN